MRKAKRRRRSAALRNGAGEGWQNHGQQNHFLGGWTGGRLAFTGGGAPEAWDDTKGVPPVVECFSRVRVEALNFNYPLETTRCFIYLLNI
jgi:hypothetical protein